MSDAIAPPTPLARQFVRLLVGFGVGVGVGSAPFLGTVDVPLFEQIVEVFPNEGRNRLFALGAFAMGVVAVAIQFYAGESSSRQRVRRLFSRTLVVIVVALATLGVLVVKFVGQMDVGGGGVASFVIAGERPAGCPCPARLSDQGCLSILTANPAVIDSCWDADTTENVELALLGSYLLLTSGFGALIGLLLLQRVARQQATARKSSQARRKAAKPGQARSAARPPRRESEPTQPEPTETEPTKLEPPREPDAAG